jgi:hypothetical protein
MKGDFRVLPNGDDGWKVQRDGNQRATARFETKATATTDARDRSRNAGTELFIHNRNGQIGARDSHGNDPRRYKG